MQMLYIIDTTYKGRPKCRVVPWEEWPSYQKEKIRERKGGEKEREDIRRQTEGPI